MLQGKAVHKTNEMIYNDKKAGLPLIPRKQAAELLVYNFDTALKEAVEEENFTPPPTIDKDMLYGEIINVGCEYIRTIVPHIIPVATELEFIYESRCGVDILMYIDLVKQSIPELPMSRAIVDYKITGKKWTYAQLAGDLQFMLYTKSLGISEVEIHNLVKGKKKDPVKTNYVNNYVNELDINASLKCIKTTYKENEYNHLETIIESAARLISSGVFMPADPSSWVCTEKWCEFYRECRGKLT